MLSYPEYKSANLPWLSDIPSHWELKRNKNVFTEKKEEVGEHSDEYTLLSLTLKGIVPRDMNGGGKFPSSFEKYKKVESGNMAFCLFDIDETPRTVGLSNYNGMLTGAYTIMQVDNIVPQYAYYYYLALDNRKMLRPLYTGLRKTISTNTFLSTKLPVPPTDEQMQIVRFLDWKTSSINKLISNYRHEISSLNQMKQRLIDDSVISGLRGDSLVHCSNKFWDVLYPEHWEIQRIRESFSFRKGLNITKANLEDNGVPVINYGQVHSKKNTGVGLNEELIKFVNKSYLQTNQSSLVEKGDFIFADTSEDLNGCGNCAFVDSDGEIFAGYHTIIAHPNRRKNNKFLAYLFRSSNWRYQIRKKANGVKVYSITQQMLKDACILLPPQEEQDEIVSYLDRECSKIDNLISSMENKIVSLRELKTRIIENVSFGRIDVRKVDIPAYEYIDDVLDSESEEKEDLDSFDEQED